MKIFTIQSILILMVVFIDEGILGKKLKKVRVINGTADSFNYNSMDTKDRSDYVERCDESEDNVIENEDCMAIQNIENDINSKTKLASASETKAVNSIFCSTGERPKPKSFFKLVKEATNKFCCEDIVVTPLPDNCCQPVVTDDSSILQYFKTTQKS